MEQNLLFHIDYILDKIYVLFYLILDELPWKNQSNEKTTQIKNNIVNNKEYGERYSILIDILYLKMMNFLENIFLSQKII